MPPPPTLVIPLNDVLAIVTAPDVGELITTVPTLLANPLNNKLIPEVLLACEHVNFNCPPELKKYLAASPLAKVTVCVKVNAEDQVLAYTTELGVVAP